jgi:AraC-like DNA-binding protein
MDKTTRHEPVRLAEPWVPRAVRGALDLMPEQLVGPPQPWSAVPARQRPGPRGRYASGMHSHAVPELCIVLSGRPFMDIESHRFHMAPPAVAVLPPQVRHCEGWTDARQGYEVSWICPSQVSVHISHVRYGPDTGWTILKGYTLASPAAASLMGLLGHPRAALERGMLEALRANLLAIYGQLHQHVLCAAAEGSQTLALSPARHRAALEQVRHLMDHHLSERWSLEQLANLTRLTPNYLNRLFKQWMGRSIHQYLTDRRMDQAMRLLREKRWLIKEIARRVGYDDPLYFSRAFFRHHGRWPTQV